MVSITRKEESVTTKYAEKLKKRVLGILDNSIIQQKLLSKKLNLSGHFERPSWNNTFDLLNKKRN